jgi:hypothetical protein
LRLEGSDGAGNYDVSQKWYEYNESERKALTKAAESGKVPEGASPMVVEA